MTRIYLNTVIKANPCHNCNSLTRKQKIKVKHCQMLKPFIKEHL